MPFDTHERERVKWGHLIGTNGEMGNMCQRLLKRLANKIAQKGTVWYPVNSPTCANSLTPTGELAYVGEFNYLFDHHPGP